MKEETSKAQPLAPHLRISLLPLLAKLQHACYQHHITGMMTWLRNCYQAEKMFIMRMQKDRQPCMKQPMRYPFLSSTRGNMSMPMDGCSATLIWGTIIGAHLAISSAFLGALHPVLIRSCPTIGRSSCQHTVSGHQENCQGVQALHALQGHSGVVSQLLAAGAAVDQQNVRGRTPLFLASLHGHPQAAKELLAAGASIDCSDTGGMTPLHAAVG